MRTAQRTADYMAARSASGRILETSSISATVPTPFETVYERIKALGFRRRRRCTEG